MVPVLCARQLDNLRHLLRAGQHLHQLRRGCPAQWRPFRFLFCFALLFWEYVPFKLHTQPQRSAALFFPNLKKGWPSFFPMSFGKLRDPLQTQPIPPPPPRMATGAEDELSPTADITSVPFTTQRRAQNASLQVLGPARCPILVWLGGFGTLLK